MSRSLEDIHQQLQCAVEGIVSSEEWKAMLRVASRFHSYSVNNQLLIFAQRPDATRVAGYRAWQGREELIDHILVSAALVKEPDTIQVEAVLDQTLPAISTSPSERRSDPHSDHAPIVASFSDL